MPKPVLAQVTDLTLSFMFALLFCLLGGSTTIGQEKLQFNRDIRPILSDKCFSCHGPDAGHREADLRLDQADSALAPLDNGAAIVPLHPEQSLAWQRILSTDPDTVMPPPSSEKSLSPTEKETIRRWIEEGGEFQMHWAFAPLTPPSVPSPVATLPDSNEIDRFIQTKWDEHRLPGAELAAPRILLRRLYFDLTGLPPSPEAVANFENDPSFENYQAIVDQLLNSPHFGERMAMYWLDLVRYADTVGYHGDQDHNISPYRDWVIQAFNNNQSFREFSRDQIAGDLVENRTELHLVATGYNRVLQTSHEGGVQKKEYMTKYLSDRVRNFGQVWLGTTLGCAECHSHKYDPYTQKDYYQIAAFFADVDDTRTFAGTNDLPTPRLPELDVQTDFEKLQISEIEKQISQLESASPLSEADQKLLMELLAKQEQLKNAKRRTMVTESIPRREIRVLSRGDWMDETGEIVSSNVPSAFAQLPKLDRPYSRLDLVNWLFEQNKGQTSRVFVNRIWALFFRYGLSRTLEDVGSQGELPSHPELLEWLAQDFVESNWNIKELIRKIVLSRTYRLSSDLSVENGELDIENRLLTRQNRFRLPAEMIRDNSLAVSKLLVRTVGGPSVKPYQPVGYYSLLNFPTRTYVPHEDERQYRRGVYMHWQRTYLHPMLRAFDAPTREECVAQRAISNTPIAALNLLNDPSAVEAARALADSVLVDRTLTTNEQRISALWRSVLQREPTTEEVDVARELLESQLTAFAASPDTIPKFMEVGMYRGKHADTNELAAWTMLGRALLNLSETITRY